MTINEMNFLFSLSRIRKKAFSFLELEMYKIGIKDIPPSYGDILYLLRSGGSLSSKEMTNVSKKDKSTVFLIINVLERKGYVTKIRNVSDGRSIQISLTDRAQNYSGSFMYISGRLNMKLFSGFSEKEKITLFKLLSKVSINIKQPK